MSRSHVLLIAIAFSVVITGCRNRCNPGYNNWYGGNPTIAPPPTYSLNIPSVAQNPSAYYNRPDTGNNAPTPAQPGWRPSDENGASANPGGNQNAVPGNNRPTTFVERGQTGFPQQPQTVIRTATNVPLPGTGVSSTNSTNYSTTSVDERNDGTRLPVTDASTVRAPSRAYPAGNAVYPAAYSTPVVPQQTYVAQNNLIRQGQPIYSGYGVLVGGQPGLVPPPTYGGQVYLTNPQAAPLVNQSSTTTGSGVQPGWRDRDRSSDRDRL